MMFNKNHNKSERIPRAIPALRADVAGEPPSPVQYASRSRRLSEEAALAAQHVLDMEQELAAEREMRNEQTVAREVSDRENERLKADLARQAVQHEERIRALSADRDFHRERYVEIVTKLNAVATLIVNDVEQQPRQPPTPPAPPETLEDELARLVAAEHEAKV